jgi:pSer/pThr/pTyr-binding forkhead associated (FHA) protein
MSDCDIRFEDSSLSRYHCFLYFDENWLVQDGDGKKSSTNGTWLFAEQFTELDDEMVFKAGETLFKCSLSVETI